MTEDELTYGSDADRDYWREFERRLESLPGTEEDAVLRGDLVALAYVDQTHRMASQLTATEYADLVHRLRFGLGPTVSRATLDDVARTLMEEAADFLEAGVSPEMLGLVSGRRGVR